MHRQRSGFSGERSAVPHNRFAWLCTPAGNSAELSPPPRVGVIDSCNVYFVGSATRCRVDCHRINAGVAALGNSLRLIAAERSH